MPRLQPVTQDSADAPTVELLKGIQRKLGGVPNLLATMANSPAVAKAYLGMSQELSAGRLSARLREQIALTVGQSNSCDYCVAAHTVLGKKAGLSEGETVDARRAAASEPKEHAALEFAQKVVKERGWVSDEDVHSLRQHGYDDGEIAEIVANVVLNILTNYFNHVAGTEVDFPAPPELASL